MLRLMLLRHAKAARAPQYDDFDRPLEERGREGASLMGKFIFAEAVKPEAALVSSACRTRETWDVIARYLGGIVPQYSRALYLASPETILENIHSVGPEVRTLLVVGHNPGLALLAAALVGKGDAAQISAMRSKFPTSALATIDFDVERWQDVGAGQGELISFMVPKTLEAND